MFFPIPFVPRHHSHQALVLRALIIGSLVLAPATNSFAREVNKKVPSGKSVKNAGRSTTTTRVNTLLNGIGAPSATLGIDGDFYIDTVGLNIYGPKRKGLWPLPKSLVGPAGPSGKAGANGKDGRDGMNGKDGEKGAAGASGGGGGGAGPAGPQGPAGPAGPAGAQGLPGAAGVAGPQGPAGATGAQGPAGATGAQGLQGIQGLQGETGTNGSNGTPGAKGDTGAAGATGPQGIPGPVKIFVGDLNFSGPLSGSAGTSITSSNFGSIPAGKKYLLRAEVFANNSLTTEPPLTAQVGAIGVTVTPKTRFATSSGNRFEGVDSLVEYGLSIISVIDSSTVTGPDFNLRITVTCGVSTSGAGYGLNFSGHFLIEEVSEISQSFNS